MGGSRASALWGCRAGGGRSQVSVNVHDPYEVPLAEVVAQISRLAAEHGTRPVEAELVGLVPEAALAGYPDEPAIKNFDPKRDVIENVLG